MPTEPRREERLARRDRPVEVKAVEAGASPRRVVTLDDEGGGAGVEPVAVRLEHAVRVLDEIEGERVEGNGRAEPDVLRRSDVEVRTELCRMARAQRAVDAIGRH